MNEQTQLPTITDLKTRVNTIPDVALKQDLLNFIDFSAGQLKTLQETKVEEIINAADTILCKTIDLSNVPPDAVLVFTISEDNINFIRSLPALLEKHEDVLKDKNITVLILRENEGLETLNPEQMLKIGWQRVSEKRIITLS